MLFNSIEFGVFLPVVFILYWYVVNKDLKRQNLLLLLSSYVFYGWWDWRFLFLIAFSSIFDYLIGLRLFSERKSQKRRFFLVASIIVNIGFLRFFKYFNFFIDSFIDAFSILGYSFNKVHLNIILPVGISFYTFQTLSYSIDVYRRRLVPTKDLV